MEWEGFRKGSGYVAVGISNDAKMGEDTMYICTQVYVSIYHPKHLSIYPNIELVFLIMPRWEKIPCISVPRYIYLSIYIPKHLSIFPSLSWYIAVDISYDAMMLDDTIITIM